MLNNFPEDICYIVIAPIASTIGVCSNIYLLSFSGRLEKNYPTGMGFVRFLNITDLAVGLFSFVWPWLYYLSDHMTWALSYNLYWVIYMSFFHPVLRSTWSRVISFLLLLFSIERYIVVVRRNRFTLLRNIEFVKFMSLLCLSAGLLLSIPRVTWYKVTYIESPVVLSNQSQGEFSDDKLYDRKIGQAASINGMGQSVILDHPKMTNVTDVDHNLKNRSFYGLRYRRDNNKILINSNLTQRVSYITTTDDMKSKPITYIVKGVTPSRRYFRQIHWGSQTIRTYVLENLVSYAVYVVIFIITIINLCRVITRARLLQRRKENGDPVGMVKSSAPNFAERKDPERDDGNRRRVYANGNNACRRWAAKIYEAIVMNGVKRRFKKGTSVSANRDNPADSHKITGGLRFESSYGIVIIPEKEIILTRLQIWTTLFKMICIFPSLVLVTLRPFVVDNQFDQFPLMPEPVVKIFYKVQPVVHILELINIAITPWIMIMILPEIRSLTKDSVMCKRKSFQNYI
ncbi:unnamed protein product [Gordionus sp. m RMFG-2023]